MAKGNTGGKINGTTVLVILIGVIVLIFAILAFWYIKIYSMDPIVMMNRQAMPLNLSLPNETGRYQKVSDKIQAYTDKVNGSVTTFHNHNFAMEGDIVTTMGYSGAETMSTTYSIEGDTMQHNITFNAQPLSDYLETTSKYIEEGDTALFVNAFGAGTVEPYYYTYMTQYIPMAKDTTTHKWYSVVTDKDTNEVILTTSDGPILLTDRMSASVYRDPAEVVYTQRVFSNYEIAAVENTRNQSDEYRLSQESQQLAESTSVSDDSEDFEGEPESDKAKYTHDQLVEIDQHIQREKLQSDGTIAGTTIQLTSTEEDDIAAEADITQGTIPVITVDGLHIDNVAFQYDAAKNGDTLTFKGLTASVTNSLDIQNNNSEAAEFILLLKFVSDDNRILDFVKITNLGEPLEPEEKRTFTMTLSDVKYSGTLQKIQFEVWR